MAIPPSGLSPGERTEAITQIQRKMALSTTQEVLKSSVNVRAREGGAGISAGQHSLELVYRAAIENLNELLAPQFGSGAIESAASGMDFTPEATAERIVSMATGFYDAFRERHNDENERVVQDQFMDTIRKGIEQGFEEARDILEGLDVLQGDIAANIDRTYALIQDGLAGFEQRFKPAASLEPSG